MSAESGQSSGAGPDHRRRERMRPWLSALVECSTGPLAGWVVPQVDLQEPPRPDGTQIVRPAAPLMRSPGTARSCRVIDSGSPISFADARLFGQFGVAPAFAVTPCPWRASGFPCAP